MSRAHAPKYGQMRFKEYQKKMEKTNILEDVDELNTYLRSEAKEIGPDAPFLESDQIRGGLDEDGERTRSYQSKAPLSIRYGGRRNNTEPYLPDGTFLDHQFVGPGHLVEPRSIMLGPDMTKFKEHGRRRGKFTKFYSDSSPTVSEKGWHPIAITRQKGDMRKATKDYFKNFSTAIVGRHNGGTSSFPSKGKISEQVLLSSDQRYSPLSNTAASSRAIRTPDENDVKLGWRTAADHRFKVAKLGNVFKSKPLTGVVSYNNKMAAERDHKVFDIVNGNFVHRSLATAILKLSEENRRMLMSEVDSGAFARSRTVSDRKRLIKELIEGKWNPNSIETQAKSKMSETTGVNTKLKSQVLDDVKGKIIDTRKVAKQIISSNNKIAKKEVEKLIEKIVDSSHKNKIIKDAPRGKNANINKTDVRKNANKSEYEKFLSNSKQVINYKNILHDSKNKIEHFSYEQYKNKGFQKNQSKMGPLPSQYVNNVTISEKLKNDSHAVSRSCGPMKVDRSLCKSMVHETTPRLSI